MLLETPSLRLSTQYRVATLVVAADVYSPTVLNDQDRALTILERMVGLDVVLLRAEPIAACGVSGAKPPAAVGQRIADRLAALEPVTVAYLDGPTRGGWLELALACDYRAAAGGPRTRVGFPGLRAGEAPCWGATVRLPRLVGLKAALDLLLTGRTLSAAQALAEGLIDRAFGPRMAEIHLAAYVLELQRTGVKPRRRPRLVDRLPWRTAVVLSAAHARVEREFSDDQPAPRAIVRAVAAGVRGGAVAGLAAERRSFDGFASNGGAVGAHETRERVQSTMKAKSGTNYETPELTSPPLTRVAIIGGGTVGAAVAQWALLHGCTVAIHDRDPAAAWRRLRDQFSAAVERRLVPAESVSGLLDGVFCSDSWDGFSDAELVIEAVDENRVTKRHVLIEAQRRVPRDAVLATTTTAYTVQALQTKLARPDRLVGLHFGCPAEALKRVEVAAGPATDPAAVARVRTWLAAHGREGVLVADRPGRALGRVALAYLREATALVGEGVPPATLDAAMRRWGMAWGPCEALDEIGLDVAVATLRELESAVDPRFAPPMSLVRLAAADEVGRKSNVGFYSYGRGAPRPRTFGARASLPEAAIVERLVSRLVREAVAVLCEGIVPDSATLDRMVIGAGWPPFRGGPLRYAAPAPPVAQLVTSPRRPTRTAA